MSVSNLSSILNTARSALTAHQRAVDVASQNIANAASEGYSRRRLELTPEDPIRTAQGTFGRGVKVGGVTRANDILADLAHWRELGKKAGTGVIRDAYEIIESAFNEPSDQGLAAALDKFWHGWSDLVADPMSPTARGVIRERGTQVANTLKTLATQLDEQRRSTLFALEADVIRVNTLAQAITEVNREIIGAEAYGGQSPELRDKRDALIDEISTLTGATVVDRGKGSVALIVGTKTIVDGEFQRPLVVDQGPPIGVAFANSTETVTVPTGSIASRLQLLNTTYNAIEGRLDALAAGIVAQVNTIHSTGVVFPGGVVPGVAAGTFFDPLGVTARSMALDAAILDDAKNIAAGVNPAGQGDTSVAAALARVGDQAGSVEYPPLSGLFSSIRGFYADLIAGVGLEANTAQAKADAAEALAQQAFGRREDVRGVSTDEEMVALIKAQQAYTAASRIINIADEMTKELLAIV